MKSFDNLNNWREEFLIQVKFFSQYINSLESCYVCLTLCVYFQASPSDPDNFPFVLLGNKVDVDGGNSRVVIIAVSFLSCFLNKKFLCRLVNSFHSRSLRKRRKHGVPRKETSHTLRLLRRMD
jgi:hypothetical protein